MSLAARCCAGGAAAVSPWGDVSASPITHGGYFMGGVGGFKAGMCLPLESGDVGPGGGGGGNCRFALKFPPARGLVGSGDGTLRLYVPGEMQLSWPLVASLEIYGV